MNVALVAGLALGLSVLGNIIQYFFLHSHKLDAAAKNTDIDSHFRALYGRIKDGETKIDDEVFSMNAAIKNSIDKTQDDLFTLKAALEAFGHSSQKKTVKRKKSQKKR